MKKIRLYAIGNDGDFNYYIFDKKSEIIAILSKILTETFGFFISFIEPYKNKKGKYKERQINIEKLKDYHDGNSGDYNSRWDIFCGDKKIFLVIHCSQRLRLKFNEKLLKIAKVPKY
jgi:hypothetical protein